MLTLISFLGGSAFRLIFGGVMDWMNKRQDHEQEMELQRLQSDLEERRHTRNLESIRLQAELKVTEVKVMGDIAEQKAAADAFVEAVKATNAKTGVRWVDAWNGIIRPAGATVSLAIWMISMLAAFVAAGLTLDAIHSALTEFDKTLISAFLGVFVGDRIHTHMNKK
uniref:Holin n=1 Tax=viral metagenome TaxID=1070528 RepID=A0A6M3KG79_9ZZZZ